LWAFILAATAATLSSGAKDVHLDRSARKKSLSGMAPDHLREKLHRAKTSRRRDAVAITLTPSRDIAT
jgi:hypothetical protein